MLQFKVLKRPDEIESYRFGYYRSLRGDVDPTSNQVSIDFLMKCRVVGVFDQEGVMVAGYTLGVQHPLRLPSYVPGGLRSMSLPADFSFNDCCEVICVWKSRHLTKLVMGQTVWPKILGDVLSTHKKYLLGHNQSKHLDKHYKFFGPRSLYRGPSIMNIPSHLFIYGRVKMKFIQTFAVTLFPLTQQIKSIFKRKQRKENERQISIRNRNL